MKANAEVREVLKAYEITQTELAEFMEKKQQHINRLLSKELPEEKKAALCMKIHELATIKGLI